MDNQDIAAALAELKTMLGHIAGQVGEIHRELDDFRPILAVFKPNGSGTDVQRAGVLRALRKVGRG